MQGRRARPVVLLFSCSGPSTPATFARIYSVLGPTFPGRYQQDLGTYTLSYPVSPSPCLAPLYDVPLRGHAEAHYRSWARTPSPLLHVAGPGRLEASKGGGKTRVPWRVPRPCVALKRVRASRGLGTVHAALHV